MRRLLLAATLAAVLVAPAAAQAATATVKLHESRYGRLVDGQGRTLYLFTRDRGSTTQVTYAGHPLYYYVNDRKPGQILCQDVREFGGTWLVVSPSGRAIR
ncbi:MAG: hypothetical protein ACJ77G_15665 [Solirubrobacteraceae bacterium]